MSYENPTRAIDTQSAQHFANLQNSLVGSFKGIAKNYKEEQAARTKKLNEQAVAIDKIKKGNQKVEDDLRNNMAKFGAQNPSLNSDAWIGAIDRVNDIKNTIDLGNESAESVAKLRQELAEISALPTLGKTMVENMTQGVIGLDDALKNVGNMGGADMYGDSTIIKDLMVWQNLSPGNRKQVIKKNPKNGKWEMSIVVNGNSYTSEQLSNLNKGSSGLVAMVSDQSSNFDNYTKMVRTKNAQTGKPEFAEGVLGDLDTKIVDGQLITFRPVNADFVKKKAKTEIAAAINNMSPNDKAVFWNNRLTEKGAGNQIIGTSMSAADFDDPAKQQEFVDAYTEKWFTSQVGKEVEISSEKIKGPKDPTPEEDAKDIFNDIIGDVQNSVDIVGAGATFNEQDNTVEFIRPVTTYETDTDGKQRKIVTDMPMKFDLNTQAGMQDYVNSVVDRMDNLLGQKNGNKRMAIKKLVGRHFKDKKKESDDYFSKEADKAIGNNQSTGTYDPTTGKIKPKL